MSETAYHSVNYRKFEITGAQSTDPLEELLRKALSKADGAGTSLWDRPGDRVFLEGAEDGRQILLNKVADLEDAVFGELCLAQGHDLQALLNLEPSSVQLSDLTTATVYNLDERTAPDGTQFIRGMIYFLVISNHVFFVKLHAMNPSSIKEYFDWLLSQGGARMPDGATTHMQAEFDVSKVPGGVGEITSLRVSGNMSSQMVLPISAQIGAPREATTKRKLFDRLVQFKAALPVLTALVGAEKAESLVASLGDKEYLSVDASVRIKGTRTEQSKKIIQQLSNELADRGDGKVEVAVGAQWNPGETTDTTKSGSVHYLIRPKDPTQLWEAIELHHEPTIHRMRWVKSSDGHFYLVVLPLHGRGNKNGEGEGVKMIAYKFPKNPKDKWNMKVIDQSMHLTHNLDITEKKSSNQTELFIAGKEGIRTIPAFDNKSGTISAQKIDGVENGAGEVRIGNRNSEKPFIVTIEPMHGVALAVYTGKENKTRVLLDDQFKEGHALATADLLGLGYDQVVAGWRVPNAANKTGVKLYVPRDKSNTSWDSFWIDENGMATEDLQVLDLNADGKPDIVAAGRATKNLKIYWNRSK